MARSAEHFENIQGKTRNLLGQFYPQEFLINWILSFDPAWYNFILDPSGKFEFYPIILADIEFYFLIRKLRRQSNFE